MSHSSLTGAPASAERPLAFGRACDALANALSGAGRREIVAAAWRDRDFGAALARLRTGMRSHAFRTGRGTLDLGELVATLDTATRRDGFHVFLEWHEVAYRFIEEDIPVVLLDYVAGLDRVGGREEGVLAILLDYYFLYVLALCATRAWDEGDPPANLDRVTALVGALQGPSGSGRRFVDDAETLLWIAISTYEPDDLAYHRLLERVLTLSKPRRLRVARVGAPLLGCHLRWGFPHLYECDLGRMRADNFIDYPWLLFSVAELVDAYDRLASDPRPNPERLVLTGALLNGLTPDPEAFCGEPPASLGPYRDEHARTRALLTRHKGALLQYFARHAPDRARYSPLGFHFNFPHNAVFATAVLAVLAVRSEDAPNASLNDLLTGDAPSGTDVGGLADRLTAFAAANPEPRGSRSVLGLYQDADAAVAAYQGTVAALERIV
jgi:hypothetical protein